MARTGNLGSIERQIARELRTRDKEKIFRCALCRRRVRTTVRMNSDFAVETPIRHNRSDGEKCNGWLTAAEECWE